MKLRLTLIDILAEVRDLRATCLGQRLINVYDLDERTFLLRLAEPGREKAVLLIESGTRLHTTKYSREKPKAPGPFATKLRKHIRGKRLNGIDVVGLDRVVDLTFGFGDTAAHLIVELYDRGNVVLTDAGYTILALLRQYTLEGGAGPGGPSNAMVPAGKKGGKGGGQKATVTSAAVAPAASSVSAPGADVAAVGAAAAAAAAAASPLAGKNGKPAAASVSSGGGGSTSIGGSGDQRAGKTGRGQKPKGPVKPIAAAFSLADAAAAAASGAGNSAGTATVSIGGAAGAGSSGVIPSSGGAVTAPSVGPTGPIRVAVR